MAQQQALRFRGPAPPPNAVMRGPPPLMRPPPPFGMMRGPPPPPRPPFGRPPFDPNMPPMPPPGGIPPPMGPPHLQVKSVWVWFSVFDVDGCGKKSAAFRSNYSRKRKK